MVKSEKEIREEVQNVRNAMESTEDKSDYLVFQGWVEALEWVLISNNEQPRNNNYELL